MDSKQLDDQAELAAELAREAELIELINSQSEDMLSGTSMQGEPGMPWTVPLELVDRFIDEDGHNIAHKRTTSKEYWDA